MTNDAIEKRLEELVKPCMNDQFIKSILRDFARSGEICLNVPTVEAVARCLYELFKDSGDLYYFKEWEPEAKAIHDLLTKGSR